MRRPGQPRTSVLAVWRWPVILATLTMFGLLSALLGQDGIWLWASWIALLAPLGVIVLCLARSRLRSDALGRGSQAASRSLSDAH